MRRLLVLFALVALVGCTTVKRTEVRPEPTTGDASAERIELFNSYPGSGR